MYDGHYIAQEYGKGFGSFITFYLYQDADIFVSNILNAFDKEGIA